MSSMAVPRVVSAQLSFLAIYNPSLGTSDETFRDQVVFYSSKAAKARSKVEGKNAQADKELHEQENEKLRQIGLAQGMVGFARSFSKGAAVDSVDTEKSRIVLHELEEKWWLLASIDLTQLPATDPSSASTSANTSSQPAVEYSSREVSPPGLLLQQLRSAHNVFHLHHGASLDALLRKHKRTKFCNILDTFWLRFAHNWDVLLHGSPAVDIYNGMKLAAGGELGMGVGEEDWGSGERLVLEDFVQKTEGLVDLIVSRFGEPSPLQDAKPSADSSRALDAPELTPWVASGKSPRAADGVVFSGVGAIKHETLRNLSHWIRDIYRHGDHAYGVRDNPTADRRKRPRKNPKSSSSPMRIPDIESHAQATRNSNVSAFESGLRPGIPPPIVKAVESSLDKASSAVASADNAGAITSISGLASLGDAETWVKYLTLGYGPAWGGGKAPTDESTATPDISTAEQPSEVPMTYVEPQPDTDVAAEKLKAQIQQENEGYFLIGLKGGMQQEDANEETDAGSWNYRTVLRTVYVEMNQDKIPETPGTNDDETPVFEQSFSFAPASIVNYRRVRPVVYVHRPFIYTFLFKNQTDSLNYTSFYRNLHSYFSPLHRPLSNSTSPEKIAVRLNAAFNPYTTTSTITGEESDTQPVFDLVFDPRTLTVHSSIPNIPDPGDFTLDVATNGANSSGWGRLEALNVHSQVLATVASTRRNLSDIERTCKTSRGWWVVWMRLPPSQAKLSEDPDAESQEFDTDQLREAFLVRRAREATSASSKSSGSRFASGIWRPTVEKMGGAAAGWGPKGLAEGIGFDARRYVEGLLSLNR